MPPSDNLPDRKIFRVRLAQGWKIAFSMVLPPLLILPGIYLLAQIRGLSETVVFGVIAVMVISLCATTIWLVFRTIPFVDYSVEGDRHRVELLRHTFLSARSFEFLIGEVTGFQVGQSNGRLYFTVMRCRYPGRFSINAASDRAEDSAKFEELMLLVASRLSELKPADCV